MLDEDFIAKLHAFYDKGKVLPGWPSWEEEMASMGDMGRLELDIEAARSLLQDSTLDAAHAPEKLYQMTGDGKPMKLPDVTDPKPGPWAEIAPGVLGRFIVQDGTDGPNLLEFRLLPGSKVTCVADLAGFLPLMTRGAKPGNSDYNIPLFAYPVEAPSQAPILGPCLSWNAVSEFDQATTLFETSVEKLEFWSYDVKDSKSETDLAKELVAKRTKLEMDRLYNYPEPTRTTKLKEAKAANNGSVWPTYDSLKGKGMTDAQIIKSCFTKPKREDDELVRQELAKLPVTNKKDLAIK